MINGGDFRMIIDTSAHHQRDRVAVRHCALARARDPGRRFKKQGTADGVQAARHGAALLAAPRWRSAIAAGSCRREIRRWSSPGPTEKLYSLNRQPTEGSRLIMTGGLPPDFPPIISRVRRLFGPLRAFAVPVLLVPRTRSASRRRDCRAVACDCNRIATLRWSRVLPPG